MLTEVWTWLRTPCAPAVRRLGYLKAAVGLDSRAARCHNDWSHHRRRMRAALRVSFVEARNRNRALVLGSGSGLEYDLADLARMFQRVTLVDIVHLPGARRKARNHSNVDLIELDLTGIVDYLDTTGKSASRADILNACQRLTATPDRFGPVDWVVSCNILSQLALLPVQWLRRHRPDIGDDFLEDFGRALMCHHLELLSGFSATRCLIADATQTLHDANDIVIEYTDYAAAFDLDRHAYAMWEWPVAPRGELAGGMRASHRVVACRWPDISGLAEMLDNTARLA